VYRARQGKPVANRVRAALGHRPDVRRLRLGAPAAIDQLDARHRAGRLVGRLDRVAERGVAHRPAQDAFDHWSLEIRCRFHHPGGQDQIDMRLMLL
jgi:hypothetical protein